MGSNYGARPAVIPVDEHYRGWRIEVRLWATARGWEAGATISSVEANAFLPGPDAAHGGDGMAEALAMARRWVDNRLDHSQPLEPAEKRAS